MKTKMYLVDKKGTYWNFEEDEPYIMKNFKQGTLMGGVDICFEDEGLGATALNLYDDFHCVMTAMIEIPKALLEHGETVYQFSAWNESDIPISLTANGQVFFDHDTVGPTKRVLQACLDLSRKWIDYELKLYDYETTRYNNDLKLISELDKKLELLS